MRVIGERWFVGPVIALFVLYGCLMASVQRASERTEVLAQATLSKVYDLASKRQFAEIKKSGLLSADDLRYLEMQDACFGPIKSWDIESIQSSSTGRHWVGFVNVQRARIHAKELIAGPNPHTAHLQPAYGVNRLAPSWTADYSSSASDPALDSSDDGTVGTIDMKPDPLDLPVITDYKEALSRAKVELWKFDGLKQPTAARRGDYWLITAPVYESGSIRTYYMVLSSRGTPLEAVEAVASIVPAAPSQVIEMPVGATGYDTGSVGRDPSH